MSLPHIIIAVLTGYVFGNCPNGYLYARAQGVDIFKQGSGNPGSTNISRTLGKKAGITVLLLDIAKCIVPVFLLHLLWKPATVDEGTLITVFTGFGAILGHDFPLLPKLHGGKGVACTGALLIAFDLRLTAVLLLFLIVIVKLTGYVSAASISALLLMFVLTGIFGLLGWLPMSMAIYPEVMTVFFLIAVLGIWQHRSNIRRLLTGTESKFKFKKQ